MADVKPLRILLLLAGVSLASAFEYQSRNGRIWGGQVARNGQFPFVVPIMYPYTALGISQMCDGSIINEKWVLTAARCIPEYQLQDYYILAGTNLLDTDGTNYTISSAVVHPDYNATILANDIALIQIQKEFAFGDTVQPILIGEVANSDTCAVLGWGITIDDYHPNQLFYAEMDVLSEGECTEMSQGADFVVERNPGQICAFGGNGTGICYRDYGGPLVCDDKLVGLVSYSTAECARGYPDVYTKAVAYEIWIKSVIGEL